MNKKILFLLIFCEGYIVLSSELIAMRQLIPFIGSGTEVTSIIISAVLLPMAIGYHYGGSKNIHQIRKKLISNFLISQIILTLGLSYMFIGFFYEFFEILGIHSRIVFCFIYSTIFLVVPVFLLAQTIPLATHYFSRKSNRKITANILFFSTIGSFLGSIFTTLILMQYVGVNYAVIFTLLNFIIMIIAISKKQYYYEIFSALVIFLSGYAINSHYVMNSMDFVSLNQYSNIAVIDLPEVNGKLLSVNNSASSQYTPNKENNFEYVKYINENFIDNIKDKQKEILILGAGAFIIGIEDKINQYDYVDIDESLQNIAEEYILPSKLDKNKKFIHDSAFAYLKYSKKSYDIIIVDVYSNYKSIPLEASVREFWHEAKSHLNPEGILIANIISSPDFNDKYSVRIDNSFRSVFKNFNRQVIPSKNFKDNNYRNIIYSYYHNVYRDDNSIYSLNKTTHSMDK